MNKVFFIFTIVCLLGFSCQKEAFPEDFVIGQEENFHCGIDYLSTDNTIKFSITEINDSRCPSDLKCFWAGKADVKIELESPVKATFVLSTLDNGIYNSTDTVGNYSFQLIDVLPYPVSTETIKLEDYIVKLKIEELVD